MAIIRQGIHGGFSGKVAKVVGLQLNGQDVMRGLPRERTSEPTEAEMLNREKFKASQLWLQPIIDFLRIGFQDHAPTFQGFVAAKSYNSKHALKTDDGKNFYIDPNLALVSFGTLEPAKTAAVDVSVPGQIKINWDKSGRYGYNDNAMVLAYGIYDQTYDDHVVYHTAIARRQHGTGILDMTEYAGKKFHVYLAFVTEDRKNRSNSQYLGEIEVG